MNEEKNKKLEIGIMNSNSLNVSVIGDTIDEIIDKLEELIKKYKFKGGAKFIIELVKAFSLSENQLARLDMLIVEMVEIVSEPEELLAYVIMRKVSSEEYKEQFLNALCSRQDSVNAIVETAEIFQFINEKAEEYVIEKGNTQLLFRISKVNGADIIKIKKAMLKAKCICFYEIIEFFSYWKDIITQEDIKELVELAKKSSNIYDIIMVANVEGADICQLETRAEQLGADAIFRFALKVKKADINRLRVAMYKTGDSEQIGNFIKKFGKGDKRKIFRKK